LKLGQKLIFHEETDLPMTSDGSVPF
jgi:hypothetical protein